MLSNVQSGWLVAGLSVGMLAVWGWQQSSSTPSEKPIAVATTKAIPERVKLTTATPPTVAQDDTVQNLTAVVAQLQAQLQQLTADQSQLAVQLDRADTQAAAYQEADSVEDAEYEPPSPEQVHSAIAQEIASKAPDPSLADAMSEQLDAVLYSDPEFASAIGSVTLDCAVSLCSIAIEHSDGKEIPFQVLNEGLLMAAGGAASGAYAVDRRADGSAVTHLYMALNGTELPAGTGE